MEMISIAGLFLMLIFIITGSITCLIIGKKARPFAFGCLLPCSLLLLLGATGLWRCMFLDEPLFAAAAGGNIREANRLLFSGADPNTEFEGTSALSASASADHADIVLLLIAHGANVNNRETSPPLSAAVEAGHADVVRILLSHGADVTVLDTSTGHTPLQVAQIKGDGEIKRLLIQAGATK